MDNWFNTLYQEYKDDGEAICGYLGIYPPMDFGLRLIEEIVERVVTRARER